MNQFRMLPEGLRQLGCLLKLHHATILRWKDQGMFKEGNGSMILAIRMCQWAREHEIPFTMVKALLNSIRYEFKKVEAGQHLYMISNWTNGGAEVVVFVQSTDLEDAIKPVCEREGMELYDLTEFQNRIQRVVETPYRVPPIPVLEDALV